MNTPFLNTNYVYMLAHFSKLQDGSFPDGKPYLFQLKNSLSPGSDGIESVRPTNFPNTTLIHPTIIALTYIINRSLLQKMEKNESIKQA